MKKMKLPPLASPASAYSKRVNLFWGLLAALAWAVQLLRLHDSSAPFPLLFLVKGWVLVGAAAFAYHASGFRKGFSFLGMFPLLWLALSRFQWEVCAAPDFRYWLWLVFFLGAEFLIFSLSDGRKLLTVLVPLWAGMAWLSPAALPLPLGFVAVPKGRFKNAGWAKWGGVLGCVLFFLLLRGWRSLRWDWVGIIDVLLTRRFAAFFLLGWLGLAAFPQRGTFRYAVTPMFLLVMGFILWPLSAWDPLGLDTLKWTLVFFAGFGWESFRRDLMDDSWHGRAVWFALGFSLFWGVF